MMPYDVNILWLIFARIKYLVKYNIWYHKLTNASVIFEDSSLQVLNIYNQSFDNSRYQTKITFDSEWHNYCYKTKLISFIDVGTHSHHVSSGKAFIITRSFYLFHIIDLLSNLFHLNIPSHFLFFCQRRTIR